MICGSSYSKISTVIPVIQNISSEVISMVFKSPTILKLKFRACLIKFINERFDYINTSKEMNVSTLLDPRFNLHTTKIEKKKKTGF